LDDVVADAVDVLVVDDGLDASLQILVERSHEVALARPQVLGEGKGGQERVGSQLPDRKDGQHVSVQTKDFEGVKLLEGDLVDVGERVVLEVKLAKVNDSGKLVSSEFGDVVVVEVELPQIGQTCKSVIAECDDATFVQVEFLDSVTSEKVLLIDVTQVVAVQVKRRRVHGDEDRDVSVIIAGAGDDVQGPVGVVLALASERTLHAAVAGVEVAAHASLEAVSLVRTKKFFFGKIDDE